MKCGKNGIERNVLGTRGCVKVGGGGEGKVEGFPPIDDWRLNKVGEKMRLSSLAAACHLCAWPPNEGPKHVFFSFCHYILRFIAIPLCTVDSLRLLYVTRSINIYFYLYYALSS